MYTLFITLIIIASILMVLLVLIQNSKGGGLAADFAGGNQVMGAPKTADFLEKSTWTLVAVIAVLSILAVGVHKSPARVQSPTRCKTQQPSSRLLPPHRTSASNTSIAQVVMTSDSGNTTSCRFPL